MEYRTKNGIEHSVYPCTKYLTFGPWIYMVPQYKPYNVLMLGYAGGTVAGLIRKLYGDDIPITAVDIKEYEGDIYNITLILCDAKEYVKEMGKYDVIIVDLFPDNELKPCEFIFTEEFVNSIKNKCNYLIVHSIEGNDIGALRQLNLKKKITLDTHEFYYYYIKRRHNRGGSWLD